MVVKVSGGSAGSCGGLVNYLEKQERGQWFSQERDGLRAGEVTPAIDGNKRNLGRDDEKFYQVIIGPSKEELKHIGNDPAKLRDYTRAVMNEYARNFGKGIEGKDLVWFAKIEKERTHTHTDRAVQTGDEWKGKKKEGEQTHVHVIVSRTENLSQFKARQQAGPRQAGDMERKHPLKLSPATNHRATEKGAVKGGFDRTQFIRASEGQFDRQFSYERKQTETFDYSRTQQHGNQTERVAGKLAVIRADSHRQEQERAAQRQAAERRAIEQQKAREQTQNQQQQQQRARGEEKTQEPQQRPQQTPAPQQRQQEERAEIKRRGPRL